MSSQIDQMIEKLNQARNKLKEAEDKMVERQQLLDAKEKYLKIREELLVKIWNFILLWDDHLRQREERMRTIQSALEKMLVSVPLQDSHQEEAEMAAKIIAWYREQN